MLTAISDEQDQRLWKDIFFNLSQVRIEAENKEMGVSSGHRHVLQVRGKK